MLGVDSPQEAANSFLLRSADPDRFRPPDTVERANRYRGDLRAFVVDAWPETDPMPWQWNWHGGAIRDKFEAPQMVEFVS